MSVTRSPRALVTAVALLSVGFATLVAQAPQSTPARLARDVYREIVAINTVTTSGDTAKAAQAMAARLRAGGYAASDVQVFTPAAKKGNLVARLRGSGARRPILLLAHLDVVEARREDWTSDPFAILEKDGYFYGRGTSDDKSMAAGFLATMLRLRQESYKPDRDIILALETDEEIADANQLGIRWLIKNQRASIDAEFALNEGGSPISRDGKPYMNRIQTSEKIYVDYQLEAKDAGGHSSLPSHDTNPIYRLAAALNRLGTYEFPIKLNETTRNYFEKMAMLEKGQLAADMKAVISPTPPPAALARLTAEPVYNAQLRTTCVATMLNAGHAPNALPQLARATVNCRVLPGESVEAVQSTVVRLVNDSRIQVSEINTHTLSPASPLNPELMRTIERVANQFWPGIPLVPTMSAGASDGVFLRAAGIPTYGHSGYMQDLLENRNHGRDERMPVKSFDEGTEYLYRLVKALSSRQN